MDLRPYQADAIDRVEQAISAGKNVVLQMPTGAGKTRAATAIIKGAAGTTWFICHRREIERQASAAFTAAGIDHGIVSPRAQPDYSKPVQIVSVATLARRIGDMPLPSLAIWDECHHVAAKSWAALRERLVVSRHLGLTATPERLDGKGLGEWFDDLVVGPSIAELIDGGFLSPFRYFAPSDPDLTAAKLQAGDYRKRDADAAMNTPVLIGDAVAEYRRHADGKRALAFCTSVDASRALVARFNEQGIVAQHVDGTTSDDARTAAVEALAAGAIRVLSNVEVFTEGFDLPAIDAVILMRPTKSPTMLLQMIGRALRIAPNKSEAVIMDHAGLHRDHGWFADRWDWSLEGGAARARRRLGERGPRRCPECKEVRAEREPVCACGYEFPSGREVGEFDGVLTEVDGAVPEGCTSMTLFGQRHGVHHVTVGNWIKRGLPAINGRPLIARGDAWVRANVSAAPQGFETQKDFEERIGAKRGRVHYWVKHKGLPANPDGYVNIKAGLSWIDDREKFQTQTSFARRHGVTPAIVRGWVKKGLPIGAGGLIEVQSADEWLRSCGFTDLLSAEKDSTARHNTVAGFAKQIGATRSLVWTWVKRGMPHVRPGRRIAIPIEEANAWIAENVDLNKSIALSHLQVKRQQAGTDSIWAFRKRHGLRSPNMVRRAIEMGLPTEEGRIPIADGYAWMAANKDSLLSFGKCCGLSQYAFGRLIGIKTSTIQSWTSKCGLPYDPKLGIPIREALEWVRDNRPDIVIPPEAWPGDNDNIDSATSAAA